MDLEKDVGKLETTGNWGKSPWRKHVHAGGPIMVWYMLFILLSTRVEERQTTVGWGSWGACSGGMLGWAERPPFITEAISDATTGRILFTGTFGFDKTKMLWGCPLDSHLTLNSKNII